MIPSVQAVVVQGYGVASGKSDDDRFPNGTVALQIPFFKKSGLPTETFHLGTINIDISPFLFELNQPSYYIHQIRWSPHLPAENFSFFKCSLGIDSVSAESMYPAFVYWPHPSTKPDFQQPPGVLELIAPFIPNLKYGSLVNFSSEKDINFHQNSL